MKVKSKTKRVKERKIICPKCGKSDFFFDSPTIHIDIILEGTKMMLKRQLDGNQIPRRPELKTKLRREVKNEILLWTCENCDAFIDSSSATWRSLRDRALRYLK